MDRGSKILMVLTFLAFGVCDEVLAQAVTYFKNTDVTASVEYDPGFDPPNVKAVAMRKPLQWIQIDVEYTTESRIDPRTKEVAWLEDVTMKYDVLLPEVTGKPRVILSGQVEFWAIPLDGEKHYAQTFIHPQILRRYVPDLKLSKSSMRDLRVLVSFEMNQSPVGYGFMKTKSTSTIEQIGGEVRRALASPATIKAKDAIFSRSETPWGIVNLSHYELEKRK